MTKKDYELIAHNINMSYERELQIQRAGNNVGASIIALEILVIRLANALYANNNKFNKEKFYRACGITRAVED